MGSVQRLIGPFNVRSICIIGAGPSGLAVAKHLLAENAFDNVEIIEQQSEVGGVWNYNKFAEKVAVPQTSPHVKPDKPISIKDQGAPVFFNPMYNHLHTNIPQTLMAFSDLEFPKDALLFPRREDVQSYLIRYAADIRSLIKFSTQVQDVRHSQVDGRDQWTTVTNSTITGEQNETKYDALVVASGHYSVPYVPVVPGIEAFNQAYPTVISHCKSYRSPTDFVGKKVIVAGSGPSGLDVGTQISEICQVPLLNSVRSSSVIKFNQQNKEEVPPIAEYILESRSVKFADGRVESNVDAIVYCTGYLYSYPFLESVKPPIVTDGSRVRNIYKQLFNITYPSLVFTALPQKVVPFPLSEAQGATIAKVWSNQLQLPSKEEMVLSEQKQVEDVSEGKNFHLLGYPKDAEYINELHDWVGTAKDGYSKEPAYWDAKKCWVREHFAELRVRFVEMGGKAKRMEELGFDLENRTK